MVMEGKQTPMIEAVKEIWSIMVHTLKGCYDSTHDNLEAIKKQCENFN